MINRRDSVLARTDANVRIEPAYEASGSQPRLLDLPLTIGFEHVGSRLTADAESLFSGYTAGNPCLHALPPLRDALCTHLSRSLLVKLKFKVHNGESVAVLCTTEDISSFGMYLLLPCQLRLRPGVQLDMELFLGVSTDATYVQGKTKRITRVGEEDRIGYILEVDFQNVNGLAEKQIAAFIHSFQMSDRRQMLAQ